MLRHCRTEMTVASTRERSGNGDLSVCLESESWVCGNGWQWAWGYSDSPRLCKSFQRNATWLWSFLSFQKHTSIAPACVCVCVCVCKYINNKGSPWHLGINIENTSPCSI